MDTMTMWAHMGAVARSVVILLAGFSVWSLAVTADRLVGKTAVALPETARPERLPERRAQLTIPLGADGAVSWAASASHPGTWRAGSLASTPPIPGREILVAADSRLPYRTVRQVLAELNAARFERAGILAKSSASFHAPLTMSLRRLCFGTDFVSRIRSPEENCPCR